METERNEIYDVDPYKKTFGEIVVYVIRMFALISISLLTIRFFLQLFGANPYASFTNWIYESSDIVLQPFRGIFNIKEINADTGSVLDVSVLFAIVMYTLLAYWMGNLVQAWERKRLTDYKRELAKADAEKAEAEAQKKAAAAKKSAQAKTSSTTKKSA